MNSRITAGLTYQLANAVLTVYVSLKILDESLSYFSFVLFNLFEFDLE